MVISSQRSRKSMLEQIQSTEFAVHRLIEGKGKHRRQYKLMDQDLKNQFKTVAVLISALKANYESFLWKAVRADERAEKFLPEHLKKNASIVVDSIEGTLN